MKFYLGLLIAVLFGLAIFAGSQRGIDPRWTRNDRCINAQTKYPCYVYLVTENDQIERYTHEGKFAGIVQVGSAVIYSPVFDQGPVFTSVLVQIIPGGNPGDYTGFLVRKDDLPKIPG